MLNAHRSPGACRQGRVALDVGMDARLLIRADDLFPAAQPAAFPRAGVKVQNAGLLAELRVTRKDPVLIPPRLDRGDIQEAPDSAGTDQATQSRGS